MFEANVVGSHLVTQAFLPLLAGSAAEHRLVVFMSGLLSSMGYSTDVLRGRQPALFGNAAASYRVSKAALNQLMLLHAMALQGSGITVVCLHPGW